MEDRYLFIIGGYYNQVALTSVECIDLFTNTWTFKKPMNEARCKHSAVAVENMIFVLGGYYQSTLGQGALNSCEMYNVITNQWIYLPRMKFERQSFSVIYYDNYLYAFGGYNGSCLQSCEMLHLLAGSEMMKNSKWSKWRLFHSMPTPRYNTQ